MRLQDVLEIGEAGPLPLVGFGLVAVAVPWFVPSLRPQFGGLVKASAKLFLEAELGADNKLTDQLVDSSIDALLDMMPDGTVEQRRQHTDREIDRFVARARASARRRGFDARDAHRRYQKHLAKMEGALKARKQRADTGQQHALDHALHRIAHQRGKATAGKEKPELA
jgi:hypothetical protein